MYNIKTTPQTYKHILSIWLQTLNDQQMFSGRGEMDWRWPYLRMMSVVRPITVKLSNIDSYFGPTNINIRVYFLSNNFFSQDHEDKHSFMIALWLRSPILIIC